MLTILYILLGLLMVSIGAEILVRSASLLAMKAGVSPLFIGLTIVGFGTSSPELGASVTATLDSFNDISVGNVIGSSIFNIAFILGITALICPIKVQIDAVRADLLIAIAAATIPFLALVTGGAIPRSVGFTLVCALLIFVVRAYRQGKIAVSEDQELAERGLQDTLQLPLKKPSVLDSVAFNSGLLLLAFTFLILGSTVFVQNAAALARAYNVSELVIGLTIVSIGTSLPELLTSIVAALKRSPDLAIGNIIGSNIFNLLGILGVCAALKPQTVTTQGLYLDTPVLVLFSLALLPIMKTDGCISRKEGVLLLLGYTLYVTAILFFPF